MRKFRMEMHRLNCAGLWKNGQLKWCLSKVHRLWWHHWASAQHLRVRKAFGLKDTMKTQQLIMQIACLSCTAFDCLMAVNYLRLKWRASLGAASSLSGETVTLPDKSSPNDFDQQCAHRVGSSPTLSPRHKRGIMTILDHHQFQFAKWKVRCWNSWSRLMASLSLRMLVTTI